MTKALTFNIDLIENSVENINPTFLKAEAVVMHTGKNYNESYIGKEAVESALSTIYNIPVVAEYLELEDDFGTHGGKIEISDKGIKYVVTTKALGVVPETCNPRWQMIGGKECLVVDIILWAERFEELKKFIEDREKPQSMEILTVKEEDVETADGMVTVIDEFVFSALCILGSDVHPAMEHAKVTYSLNKDKMNSDLEFIFDEFRKMTQEKGGGEELTVDEKDIQVEEFETTQETDEMVDEVVEDASAEDSPEVDDHTEEFTEEVDSEETEDVIKDEQETFEVAEEVESNEESTDNFAMTAKDKFGKFNQAIGKKDNYGSDSDCAYHYVIDFDDVFVYYEKWGAVAGERFDDKYRCKYSLDESTETVVLAEDEEKVYVSYLSKEEKDMIDEKNAQTEATILAFEAKIVELEEFKMSVEKDQHEMAIDEVAEKFDGELGTIEEYVLLKSSAYNMEVQDFEDRCFSLLGKVKYAPKQKKEKKFSIVVPSVGSTDASGSYYGTAEKYLKKD